MGLYRGRFIILTETFPDHYKVSGLSDPGFRALVEAMCFARRNRSDGQLTMVQLRKLVTRKTTITELCDAHLLDPNGDRVLIHDWLDYQPAEAELDRKHRARSDAGKRGARTRWDGQSPLPEEPSQPP